MRNTFNVNFLCRPSKVNKLGLAPIELSIIINGNRTIITLPMKVNPQDFQKAITSKRMNSIKQYISEINQQILTAETELIRQNVSVTPDSLKNQLFKKEYTIKDLFTDFLKTLKASKVVYRRYELIGEMFSKFIQPNKPVTEITNAVVSGFYAELNGKYESTTAAGMISKLKTVVKFGLDNNRLKINPFNGIKINKKTKEVEFLTESEIQRIRNKEMIGRLSQVRDLFIFQCFSGLSYSDMAGLCKEDYQFSENQIFIKKNRIKTGVTYTAVLFPEAIEILKKYDYQLPIISNQKMNGYLKEIGDICGIKKPLHSHIGRHTFATMALNRGLSIEVVSKMLGHSNVKQTMHYAKLIDETVLKAVANLKKWSIFVACE